MFATVLLHGAALVAARFVPVFGELRARGAEPEEEFVFQLDLRTQTSLGDEASITLGVSLGADVGELVVAAEARALDPTAAPSVFEPSPIPEAIEEPSPPTEPPAAPLTASAELAEDAVDLPPNEPELATSAADETPPIDSTNPPAPLAPSVVPLGPTPGSAPASPELSASRNEARSDRGDVAAPMGEANVARAAAPSSPERTALGTPSSSGAAPRGSALPAGGGDENALPEIPRGSLHARRAPKPDYPEGARRRREEGTVACRLTLDREGFVLDVELLTSSGHRELDDAAMRALKRWRFEPLGELTKAKRVHALQRLTFELALR